MIQVVLLSVIVIIRTSKTMHAKQERWHMEMLTNRDKVKGEWLYTINYHIF